MPLEVVNPGKVTLAGGAAEILISGRFHGSSWGGSMEHRGEADGERVRGFVQLAGRHAGPGLDGSAF